VAGTPAVRTGTGATLIIRAGLWVFVWWCLPFFKLWTLIPLNSVL
jgi:hypothetical protein